MSGNKTTNNTLVPFACRSVSYANSLDDVVLEGERADALHQDEGGALLRVGQFAQAHRHVVVEHVVSASFALRLQDEATRVVDRHTRVAVALLRLRGKARLSVIQRVYDETEKDSQDRASRA